MAKKPKAETPFQRFQKLVKRVVSAPKQVVDKQQQTNKDSQRHS